MATVPYIADPDPGAYEAPRLAGVRRDPVRASRSNSSLPLALVLAVAVHAGLILLAVLSLSNELGVEGGEQEGVAVELVDAATLDRLDRSLTGGTSAAPASAATEATPQIPVPEAQSQPPQQAPPQTQAPQPQQPAQPSRQAKSSQNPSERSAKSAGPSALDVLTSTLESSFQVSKSGGLDLDPRLPSVGKAATAPPKPAAAYDSPLEKYLSRRDRQAAGPARSGEIDEFTRTISRIVEASKPHWSASPATAVLEFVITPNGTVEGVQITQTSGLKILDDQLVDAIRRARYVTPPETATLRDRTFEITFRYH